MSAWVDRFVANSSGAALVPGPVRSVRSTLSRGTLPDEGAADTAAGIAGRGVRKARWRGRVFDPMVNNVRLSPEGKAIARDLVLILHINR